MTLFDTTDGLLTGTRYLAWILGLLGVIGSVILLFVNIPLGLSSAMVFAAAFFLSVAVTLLLMPLKLAKGKLKGYGRYIIGAVSLLIAIVVMFVVWNVNGGFPAVNLLFV